MAFITSLRIKNFFSIKDEVTIDFKASPYNVENNPERLFEFNGEYYNKVISFYGANASGKTSSLKAITTLATIVANQDDTNFPISFKNKFTGLEVNSQLSITFVLDLNNQTEEFLYEVEFESKRFENIGIKDERLFYKKDEMIQIFSRSLGEVKNIDSNIQEAIFNNLNSHKSLIDEFYKFDKSKILDNIKRFFVDISVSSNMNAFNTELGLPLFRYEDIATWLTELSHNSDLEKFYLSFFNSIGLDISKIKINYKELDGKKKEFRGIDIFHAINPNEPLQIELESDGTQMLMKILLDIYKAKMLGSVLVLDELDSIVHPILVPIILNLLIENNIQIIYSTHNIYNMQFLQNDEIFLIEKDVNHVTKIKPIKDNKNIKGYENLLTHYENGDLGGIPKIEDLITKIY